MIKSSINQVVNVEKEPVKPPNLKTFLMSDFEEEKWTEPVKSSSDSENKVFNEKPTTPKIDKLDVKRHVISK